ncbi:hypothetical protein [Streptomyces sp. NPDC023327]|uniref:hypothetical protein n=1 Tax=Streptomyces sp. NPDC023327 TaxID=3157088 RepID=UPI003402CF34
MTVHRGFAIAGAVASAIAFSLASTSSASATSIIGFGNSASNNSCANQGGALASGHTAYVAGAVSALTAGLPVSNPTNQCGDLGFTALLDIEADELVPD